MNLNQTRDPSFVHHSHAYPEAESSFLPQQLGSIASPSLASPGPTHLTLSAPEAFTLRPTAPVHTTGGLNTSDESNNPVSQEYASLVADWTHHGHSAPRITVQTYRQFLTVSRLQIICRSLLNVITDCLFHFHRGDRSQINSCPCK